MTAHQTIEAKQDVISGAEIVVRDTPRGGAVFSVGSIVWPASLLVDEGVPAITRNVVRRFLG